MEQLSDFYYFQVEELFMNLGKWICCVTAIQQTNMYMKMER